MYLGGGGLREKPLTRPQDKIGTPLKTSYTNIKPQFHKDSQRSLQKIDCQYRFCVTTYSVDITMPWFYFYMMMHTSEMTVHLYIDSAFLFIYLVADKLTQPGLSTSLSCNLPKHHIRSRGGVQNWLFSYSCLWSYQNMMPKLMLLSWFSLTQICKRVNKQTDPEGPKS